MRGERGEGEFSRKVRLLSTSYSGDSTSLSPTSMSFLILCAKGERFEGEGTLGEAGKGHFECSLAKLQQFAGVVQRLVQPVVGNRL